jgi:UDP-sugar transporter A1/2/3
MVYEIKEHKVMFSNMYSLKNAILLSLCLQNAGYTLLRKYTTKYEKVSSKEILLLSEIIKIIFSVYMVLNDDNLKPLTTISKDMEGGVSGDSYRSQRSGLDRIVHLIRNSSKMFVLAVIYGIMNILSFVALQYIGAGEFTICAQLKILTTAVFSVIILHTSLSYTKWRALILLVLGCMLVASPVFNSNNQSQKSVSFGEELFGYAAVLTEVCLSGFASIYFEKVIKNTTEIASIWERNVQLGFYSIIMYSGIVVYESYQTNSNLTVGGSWTWITFLVALLGAAGGLLVAATLKYADSILKTLAAAGAILLSTVLGYILLDGPLDFIVSIGGLVTIIAIANYTFDSS